MRASTYVDHTVGDVKRTELGVEIPPCVKVLDVISIVKNLLLTHKYLYYLSRLNFYVEIKLRSSI